MSPEGRPAASVSAQKFDKLKVQCTYCERIVSMWGGTREMYRHVDMRGGVHRGVCPGSATKGWRKP